MSAASCNADWSEEGEQSCNKTCDKADDDNPGDVHDDCVCIHRARRQVARPDVNSSFTLHEDGPAGDSICATENQKTESRSRKPGPKPVLKTRTENPKSPVLETRTTGSDRKPGPLSISRVGTAEYPRARSTQAFAGYSSLPLELRLLALGLKISGAKIACAA
jgi:hypothetical protein